MATDRLGQASAQITRPSDQFESIVVVPIAPEDPHPVSLLALLLIDSGTKRDRVVIRSGLFRVDGHVMGIGRTSSVV
jgi:hypothetical protein